MKNHNDNTFRRTAGLIFRAVAVFLSFAMAPHMLAQSAETFTSETDIAEPTETETAGMVAKPKPLDYVPSRFAGSDVASYTASRAAELSMKDRETDPFGLYQDPTRKPVVSKILSTPSTRLQAALPPTPLSDIIKLIRVTTIMPGERKFLVGVRSFSESDEFPLKFRGKRMNLKIVKVSARSIVFRDTENGETASLETGMLPPGMLPGNGSIRPPGMVSAQDDIPLELGSGTDPESNN